MGCGTFFLILGLIVFLFFVVSRVFRRVDASQSESTPGNSNWDRYLNHLLALSPTEQEAELGRLSPAQRRYVEERITAELRNLNAEEGATVSNKGAADAAAAYFDSMGEMQRAIAQRRYEDAARHAKENLKLLPNFVEEFVLTDGPFDIVSIPGLEVGGTMLALTGDEKTILEMRKLVESHAELEKWLPKVEQHRKDLHMFSDIRRVVKKNPGVLQNEIKDLVDAQDGRRPALLLSWLEKAGQVMRKPAGKTYELTAIDPTEVSKGPEQEPPEYLRKPGKPSSPAEIDAGSLDSISLRMSIVSNGSKRKSVGRGIGKRRDFYVYVHRDTAGNIFYVGKGTGRRAWSTDRHYVWHRYVEERLDGEYQVEIVKQNLSERGAEELEDDLIWEHGDQLVNWVNFRRDVDYEALTRFHTLRDANLQFVQETRTLEKTDRPKAVLRYYKALAQMREYESIVTERGLVADLSAGLKKGDVVILDRLTLCLVKLGRGAEALKVAEAYFEEFPYARELAMGKRILKRVKKHSS